MIDTSRTPCDRFYLALANAATLLLLPIITGASHGVSMPSNRLTTSYDHSKSLVIDPVLGYSSYVGNFPASIAVDDFGNVYIAGGRNLTARAAGANAFVSKFDPAGNVVYTTYLGGSDQDLASAVSVDHAGHVVVAGTTRSRDFPVTADAAQSTLGGDSDVFLTKLDSAGAIVYSTYLGGSGYDSLGGMALDAGGNAYLTGTTSSLDFPVTPGALQRAFAGIQDTFVTKLSPTGTLVYSTYIGGEGEDNASGIAVDAAGGVYITGFAGATFPTTPGSYHPTFDSSIVNAIQAFAAKLNFTGSALVYSTYFGSFGIVGRGIAVDANGSAVVAGRGGAGFATTPGAAQASYGGLDDVFVAKLDPSGSTLVFATYLGGTHDDDAFAVAIDHEGNTVVGGQTASFDFPVTRGAAQTLFAGGPVDLFGDDSYIRDAYVTKLGPAGNLLYSTFLGGFGWDFIESVAVDSSGRIYVAGGTFSKDFPVTGGSASHAGESEGSIARIDAGTDLESGASRVVEFYDPDLGHYFMTADPVEQDFVDSGAVGRWLRTGNSFVVSGPAQVCRFYGNTVINLATGQRYGPNSHFYTANPAECTMLKGLFNPTEKSWQFESNDFMLIAAPQGSCSGGLVPVYRAYNNGFAKGIDSNHRIAANKGAYDSMTAKDWIGEGVVMCALR